MKRQLLFFLSLFICILGKAEELKLIDGLKLESLAKSQKMVLPDESADQVLLLDNQSALVVNKTKVRFYSLQNNKFIDSKPMMLPQDCVRLALIADTTRALKSLYCFGSNKKDAGDSIRLFKKGTFDTLIKTPKKISAVTGDSNRIFFISQDGLFQIRAKEGVKPVFVSSFLNGVQSMVFDSKNDLIFLASKDQIFSLRGGVLDVLAKGMGGQVLLLGNDLLILDNSNQLWRLTGHVELLTKQK